MIDKQRAKSDPEAFEVWEENWPAIEMFLRIQTQWVFAGMGSIVGLNYQSLEFLFRIYEVKNPVELLEEIQEIERGVLDVLKREAEEKNGP